MVQLLHDPRSILEKLETQLDLRLSSTVQWTFRSLRTLCFLSLKAVLATKALVGRDNPRNRSAAFVLRLINYTIRWQLSVVTHVTQASVLLPCCCCVYRFTWDRWKAREEKKSNEAEDQLTNQSFGAISIATDTGYCFACGLSLPSAPPTRLTTVIDWWMFCKCPSLAGIACICGWVCV